MKLHERKPAEGSRKAPKRVGRGIGGKGGKTAGRGTKGQKARNTIRAGFEGGQLPIQQRLPKLRGFNNPFRVEYQAVNLDTILESGLTEVSPEILLSRGLVGKGALVKVASMASEQKSGARGLRAILENALLDIMFDTPGQSVSEVMINEDVIEKQGAPLITYSKEPKTAEAT